MRRILKLKMEHFHRAWLAHQVGCDRTLVLAPRGHGKSTILTVGYSLWRIIRDPEERILVVSATGLQAQGFLREMKAHIETNRAFRLVYGNLEGDRWTDREFTIKGRSRPKKESSVTALGIDGSIISRHYDTIILDDVVDAASSRNESARDEIEEWFFKILEPCLEPGGRLHMIGTRYHPDDLYGRFIKRASEVKHLN